MNYKRLTVVQVVLVVLALFNIGLVFYIKKELEAFERHFEMTYGDLIGEINILQLNVYKLNGEILKELKTQSKQISDIPKDITVKNVLSIP